MAGDDVKVAAIARCGGAAVVLSSATFYHLVDPIGALCMVWELLSDDGFALIRHVPLSAQLGLPAGTTATALCKRLGEFWALHGIEGAACEMPDKPGLAMVAHRKRSGAPRWLRVPFQYAETADRLVEIGGRSGYWYAKATEIEQPATAAPAAVQHGSPLSVEALLVACGVEVRGHQISSSPHKRGKKTVHESVSFLQLAQRCQHWD